MTNILKKIEGVVYEPVTSTAQTQVNPLKNEVIDNIEELSKEVNYLKDKVKTLVADGSDQEEVADTIFKLRDLQESMKSRKQQWEKLLSHEDIVIRQETLKAINMLISTTEKLENTLEEAAAYQKNSQ